jgi:hypothetical protein
MHRQDVGGLEHGIPEQRERHLALAGVLRSVAADLLLVR